MQRVSESRSTRPSIWFGLRPRMLGALVLTATVTLATAALTLLAPLQSQLRHNSIELGISTVDGDKTALGILPVTARGLPTHDNLKRAADKLFHGTGAEYVVWDNRLQRQADTNDESNKPEDYTPPEVVRDALHPIGKVTTPFTLNGDILVVATRYKGGSSGGHVNNGRFFVLEMIKHVDYLATADSVVRTAFLYAALVGLGVAVLLGLAFSSRLLRRLRQLRDASRSLDEGDMSTLVIGDEPVSDEIGELASAFATMRARLRQQEDARRAFVATASHELRTPLASLDTMLELLAEDLHAEPVDVLDARERVGLAQIQSRRLANLATDLLDLSRIDAQLDLRSEPVELVETARAVSAEFDLRAQAREIAIVLDPAGEGAWAQADPGSVARIIRIMLDNALKVAPAHSRVEVRVANGSGPPAIEVADEGPGVPEDERELIFERFKRGSERGSEGGFGLGLAIGTELASRMGGRLELTATRPGATFRLTLPEVPA
jgi:signal transduction histidine kinase